MIVQFTIIDSQRTVADVFAERYAVRRSEVAWARATATGAENIGKKNHRLRRTKTYVKGKGKYKTWTAVGMLRVSLLESDSVSIFENCI